MVYEIEKSQDESLGILVLSYLCKILSKPGTFETDGEAGETKFRKFNLFIGIKNKTLVLGFTHGRYNFNGDKKAIQNDSW